MSYVKYQGKMVVSNKKYVTRAVAALPQPSLQLLNGLTVDMASPEFSLNDIIQSVSGGTPPYTYQWRITALGVDWTPLVSDPTTVTYELDCTDYENNQPLLLIEARIQDDNSQNSNIESTYINLQDATEVCPL